MTHTRRNALFLLTLTGVWLALTCAALLHRCPDEESGAHRGTCEFYAHSVQAQAYSDAGFSHLRISWDAVPPAMLAAARDAAPPDAFDRSSTHERAPPA